MKLNSIKILKSKSKNCQSLASQNFQLYSSFTSHQNDNVMHFLTLTVSPCLTLGHVIKNVLHCPTVWQLTWFPTLFFYFLLILLTAISMKEEYQLLLDKFPLLFLIIIIGRLRTTHDRWKLRLTKREKSF